MPNEVTDPIERFVEGIVETAANAGLNEADTIMLMHHLLQISAAQKFEYLQTRYGTHAGPDFPN